MDVALGLLYVAIQWAWAALHSPVTLAILLLMILGKLGEQNSILLGIYRRLHLRSVGKETLKEEDYEEEYDDTDSAPIDELMHGEIEMRVGRLPRHEGIIPRTARKIARAFGRSNQ